MDGDYWLGAPDQAAVDAILKHSQRSTKRHAQKVNAMRRAGAWVWADRIAHMRASRALSALDCIVHMRDTRSAINLDRIFARP